MPRKAGAKKVPKPKKHQHPSTSEMVTTAIKVLSSRDGTSLHAIKKFVAENYDVNIKSLTGHINSFLRNAVESGIFTQSRGKCGCYKLSKLLGRRVTVKQKKGPGPRAAGTPRKAGKKEQAQKVKLPKETLLAGEVIVKNEPVKEEIANQEPDLMEDDEEEEILVKEEVSMDKVALQEGL